MIDTGNSESREPAVPPPPDTLNQQAEQQQLLGDLRAQDVRAPIQDQPSSQGVEQNHWPPGKQVVSSSNLLNYLRGAAVFHVEQKFEILELVGWESVNKYIVKDQAGNKVFFVGEKSGCCQRQCFACARPLTLKVKDATGFDVMAIDRPMYCHCFCGFWCPDTLTVSTPDGQLLGTVEKEFSIFYPRFKLNDSSGATVLKIKGPLLTVSLACRPVIFRFLDSAGVTVGNIRKEWSGLARECCTDADHYSLSLPMDLDPAMKAVCLAALFLIDYEYFEDIMAKGVAACAHFG